LTRIIGIVEGHGEVTALPLLIRRIAAMVLPHREIEIPRPIRVKRQRLLKEGELERSVELAARQSGADGKILILLDADSDCPSELAATVLERARATRADREIRAVIAKVEYETWFVAAADSLAGHRDLSIDLVAPPDPEAIGNPKRWLSDRITTGRSYRETLDQPALTEVFDLEQARRAPSFDKMWRDVIALLRTDP